MQERITFSSPDGPEDFMAAAQAFAAVFGSQQEQAGFAGAAFGHQGSRSNGASGRGRGGKRGRGNGGRLSWRYHAEGNILVP